MKFSIHRYRKTFSWVEDRKKHAKTLFYYIEKYCCLDKDVVKLKMRDILWEILKIYQLLIWELY